MNSKTTQPSPFETIEVTTHQVACDGGSSVTGHPLSFLHLDPKTHSVTCGYCSRHYVLKDA